MVNNYSPFPGTIRLVFITLTGGLVATLDQHGDYILEAMVSNKGNYLLTVSTDKTANVWDIEGKLLHTLSGHQQPVNTGCFSDDETKVLTGSRDGESKIWDLTSGQLIHSSKSHNGPILSSASNKDLFLARSAKKVVVYDLTGNVQASMHHEDAIIYSATFSTDGDYLLTASADKTAKIWKTDGTLLHTLQGHEDLVTAASFSSDGSRIVTCSADGSARLWDRDGDELGKFDWP